MLLLEPVWYWSTVLSQLRAGHGMSQAFTVKAVHGTEPASQREA